MATKERPILFSAPMVRALLAGTKTQTRRLCKFDHEADIAGPATMEDWARGLAAGIAHQQHITEAQILDKAEKLRGGTLHAFQRNDGGLIGYTCPYGKPGDRLWVRESIYLASQIMVGGVDHSTSCYAADDEPTVADAWPWERDVLPSIHMPRGLSRITLEITDVRVQRLQDISQTDALSEGITHSTLNDPRVEYRWLWESINGAGSWDANPWVWALTFRKLP